MSVETSAPPAAPTAPESAAARRVLGVGFGPSNVALAAALQEEAERRGLPAPPAAFFERRPAAAWHPGLLVPGARIQVSFLKDLATPRDPRSRYTFLAWLHERGLLMQFANVAGQTPTREMFDAYVRWVGSHFADQVHYGSEAIAVERVEPNGRVEALDLVVDPGGGAPTRRHRGTTLVLAPGGEPAVPAIARGHLGERVFHASELVFRLGDVPRPRSDEHLRFAVVGAGQSAGDVVTHLLEHDPDAHVTWVFRSDAPRPMDDTPFVNELFHPEALDRFHAWPDDARRAYLEANRHANYAAISADVLERLYAELLRGRLLERRRLTLAPRSALLGMRQDADGVELDVGGSAPGRTLAVDAVVLCTGYRRERRHRLLTGLLEHLVLDDAGRPVVDRGYRVRTVEGFAPAVYLVGLNEDTHGLSDTLLSVLAVRSGELARSIVEHEALVAHG